VSALLIPIVLASLAGSLHCAAMCGPFVAAVAGFERGGRAGPAAQSAYHLGRLLTYSLLGATAGVLGSALDLAGSLAGLSRVSAVFAGCVLVLWGASSFFARDGLVRLRRRAPRRSGAWLGLALVRVKRAPPVPRAFLLGLATTFLPCGWLYAFVATAAGTGRVVPGIAVMSAFWLGTLPALVAAGAGLQRISARLGERARVVSGSLIVLSGLLLIALRVGAFPTSGAHSTAEAPVMPASCPLHRH
jgi:sulfite exporter TauE/SafE